MTEREKPEFLGLFTELVSLYPNAPTHEGTPLSYWNHLRELPMPAVRKAILRSAKESPVYVPTAETIRRFGTEEAKHLQPMRQVRMITGDVEPAYGLPADHPAMKIARYFEEESAHLGLDPDKPTPEGIATKRMRMINQILGGQIIPERTPT